MPFINRYKCNKCDFSLHSGYGGYLYVEDDQGKRISCPHPCESIVIFEVLGKKADDKEILKEKIGFNSHCLCFDCLYQFEADLRDEKNNSYRRFLAQNFGFNGKEKDKRECPHCMSRNVKTITESINNSCPKCNKGLIKEIWTGIIS